MDKLAKRAGVTALVLIASAGSALAFGLFQMASSLDRASADGKQTPLPVVAAIRAPDLPVVPIEIDVPLVAPAEPVAAPKQATRSAKSNGSLVNRPKPALAPMRVAAATPQPEPAAPRSDTALDGLDVSLGVEARERGLDDRGSKAFAIRQMGGVERLRRAASGGERITFETDLGRP
jgi:hypothetical protein